MLQLKNVTLITVDGVNPERAVKALNYSSREIEFGEVSIVSFKKPDNLTDKIKFSQIDKLTSPGYNRFIGVELYKYFNTDFCIVVQPDGFLLNANQWTDEFLDYDYIGAPWPSDFADLVLIHKYKKAPQGLHRVGNGGFSLRSHRLQEAASKYNYVEGPEDNFFCFDRREDLENLGMKYAPVELASRFSMECPLVPGKDRHLLPIDFSKHLGFHGLYPYLWKYLD